MQPTSPNLTPKTKEQSASELIQRSKFWLSTADRYIVHQHICCCSWWEFCKYCDAATHNNALVSEMINAQDYHDTVKIGAFDDSYQAVQTAVQAYIEGLHWALQSYYGDVPSWEWHYPFQHAPMTSDFVRLKRISITFTQGTPLKPLQQLLAVLPRTSYWLLPPAYQVNGPH